MTTPWDVESHKNIKYNLLNESEALMYWPSDSEVNTSRLRSEISL